MERAGTFQCHDVYVTDIMLTSGDFTSITSSERVCVSVCGPGVGAGGRGTRHSAVTASDKATINLV